MAAAGLDKLVERLEKVASKLEAVALKGTASKSSDADVDTAQVDAFESLIKSAVDPFLKLSNSIGAKVAEQAKLVGEAFQKQKDFLGVAARFNAPAPADLPAVLKPTSDIIAKVVELRDGSRADKHFNHLSAVSESIGALGWVTVSPKPKIFCKDMADAGQFYTNRVIKEFKEKDTTHMEWAKSLNKIFKELTEYIGNYHPTGVTWNPSRPPASGAPASAPAAGGAPPPPPGPPPPPPPAETSSATKSDDSASRNALFAALNKGSDITSGLKKVSKDQMTHKNPALRNTGPVPYKAPSAAKPVSAPKFGAGAQAPKKPPKFELEGKKWLVEFQDGNKNIIIDDVELNQTVYVYRCTNSVIQVKGKVNSITLDGCKKTGVVFEDLVSMVEFINCQSVQCQANGVVPTISIEKTDGCQLYLKEACLGADIVSAKSSEMNLLVVKADGDMTEYPIPEQFKTKWTGKGIKTEVNDIAG